MWKSLIEQGTSWKREEKKTTTAAPNVLEEEKIEYGYHKIPIE